MYIKLDPARHAASMARMRQEVEGIHKAGAKFNDSANDLTGRWEGDAPVSFTDRATEWSANLTSLESLITEATAGAEATATRLRAANDAVAGLW